MNLVRVYKYAATTRKKRQLEKKTKRLTIMIHNKSDPKKNVCLLDLKVKKGSGIENEKAEVGVPQQLPWCLLSLFLLETKCVDDR